MTKFGTMGEYPAHSLPSAEAALLTAWRSLKRYHDDLVLVGGLAVHYLTRRTVIGFPGTVTMDVDFGVSLATSGGQYGTIQSDLAGLGFKLDQNRLIRRFHGLNLYIDFLTEHAPATTGVRIVDDVVASVVPGVSRALACHRHVPVRGRDLFGVEHECRVRIADIGPLLVLKLNAFGGPTGRRHPKDAYDVLLAVTGFVDGAAAAIASFHAEKGMENTAMESALKTLRTDFSETDQDGPTRAADFMVGDATQRERVRQDVVTVARMLLGA